MTNTRCSLPVRIVLIAALLPAVVLSARAQKTPGSYPGPVVAKVNGSPIPWSLYDALRQDHIDSQRQRGGSDQIDQLTDDALFLQLVDAELIEQEAAKRKITVNRDAATRLLLDNPPEFMKEPFMDAGRFRKDLFTKVVSDPRQIATMIPAGPGRDSLVRQWRADLDKVIRYVQVRETKVRLAKALAAEKPLTENAIRHHYFAEKTYLTGSVVSVLHSSIPDSLIPIGEKEMRAWYDAHKEDYRAAPARLIAATILPIIPSAADSARQKLLLDSSLSLLRAAPKTARAGLATSLGRNLPPSRLPAATLITPLQIPPELLPLLDTADVTDVIGPIAYQGEQTLLYVDGTAPTRDTMLRARHIFFRVAQGNSESETIAQEFSKNLKDSIRDERTFMEAAKMFSQDGTNANGGDIGFFGRGQVATEFENAAFAAKVGEIVGPVRTTFGYHLIMVTQRSTKGYYLRELRFPLVPSAEARAKALADGRRWAEALRTGEDSDSLLSALRARYGQAVMDTSYVKRLELYGDALAPSEWAFNARRGDIGIVELPGDRIAVIRLMNQWSGGVPTYEQIPQYLVAHARRARQLEMMGPLLKRLGDTLTPGLLLGNIREIASMSEVFIVNAQPVSSPPDEEPTILDSLVEVTPVNGVRGPVRGKHGYYFLRVQERNGPTMEDYRRDRAAYAESYRARREQAMLEEWMTRARSSAQIEDLRTNKYTAAQ